MNILVTGGAGYIGTELVNYLIKSDNVDKILVYDNLNRPNFNLFLGKKEKAPGKVQYVSGDILDSRTLRNVMKDIDVVYHLAAKVVNPFFNVDAHFFEQVNHWGTAELVYAVEESERVKKFVYVSSSAVYGSSKEPASVDKATNPRTFYGISKMRGEEHVNRLVEKNGVDTYILRCGNVYGYSEGMHFDSVMNSFMFEANFNNRISIHGKGTQVRSFIGINYVSKVLGELIFKEVPSGVYNLVNDNYNILDIVDVLKEIYTNMEYSFINQHLDLRDICVNPDSKLREYIDYENKSDLLKDLSDFKEKFSF